jgi:hypothetical protein
MARVMHMPGDIEMIKIVGINSASKVISTKEGTQKYV